MKKRVLLALLALIMILPLCIACTKGDDDGKEPATTTNSVVDGTTGASDGGTTSSSGETTTEPTYIDDDLGTLKLGGKVTVLYWSDVERTEFDVEGYTADPVDDAVYTRNITTESRLGIEIAWEGTPGNYQKQADFVAKCESGNVDGAYDIFAGYSLTGSTIALNGLSQNMLALPYLNFDKPWWPESLIGQATINDKLFFASGDISTNMLHMMYGVLFNKDMLTDLGLAENSNPYELVQNNTWTITKMMSMCENAFSDIGDTPGAPDQNDQFGYVSSDINYDGLFTCSGLKTVEKTDNGLVLSESFNSTKTIDLVEKVVDFFKEDYAQGNVPAKIKDFKYWPTFVEGRALFTMDRVYVTTSDTMKAAGESAVDYGVVPCPKYDTKQENYVTMLGFPYTLYSISSASKNPESAAALLECLGSEGYRTVTPQLFETVMKIKYAKDPVTSQMYDIIKSCVYIDLGRIFSTDLNNQTYQLFRNEIRNSTKFFATKYGAQETVLKGLLDTINNKFYGAE